MMGSERTHHKDIKSEKCFEISLSTQRYSVLKFEFPAIFLLFLVTTWRKIGWRDLYQP